MKKLFRIVTSATFAIIGAAIIFFNASALSRGVDWMMASHIVLIE